LALGYEGPEAYAKDENGNFIVEAVRGAAASFGVAATRDVGKK
jgi:hypothetical protein